MSTVTLHIGEVRDVMARLADASVDLIVTSPPFDLDAVRTEFRRPDIIERGYGGENGYACLKGDNNDRGDKGRGTFQSPHAGAPPLDHWDDDHPDWQVFYGPDGRSYVVDRRWFDLDAVRQPGPAYDPDWRVIRGGGPLGAYTAEMAATGAPPLDWQDDPGPDWQPLHNLPTHPYKGAHYATFNPALPRRLIEAMCPREVCTVCGEPRRRVVGEAEYSAPAARSALTLGWTDCGCQADDRICPLTGDTITADGTTPRHRPGIVFDPFAGSGTTAIAAAHVGRDAILIDLDHRSVDLIRRRLAENFRIVDETVDGDTYRWTVAPASRQEIGAIAAGQLSLFGDIA